MNLCFESERLRFDPLAAEDIDLAVEQWGDPDVIRYVADRTYTRDELLAEMPVVTRRGGGGCIGVWVLSEQSSHEKIGSAFLLPMPVEQDDTDWDQVGGDKIPEGDIEIGYVLKKSAWGQGFATEACQRLLRFAFEETPLMSITAVVDPENRGSIGVLRKSVFQDIGQIRAYATSLPGFRVTKALWMTQDARD